MPRTVLRSADRGSSRHACSRAPMYAASSVGGTACGSRHGTDSEGAGNERVDRTVGGRVAASDSLIYRSARSRADVATALAGTARP